MYEFLSRQNEEEKLILLYLDDVLGEELVVEYL